MNGFQGFYNKEVYYIDKRGIMIGIREPSLSPNLDISNEDMCSGPTGCKFCPPDCPFLKAYEDAINKIDFDWLVSELSRVAEDVRKVTHFEGEPEVVLLVYEVDGNPCSERYSIQRMFKKHNINLKNYEKEQ